MCVVDIDVCDCVCHRANTIGEVVRHVMACCEICPTCGKNIRIGAVLVHEQECKDDRLT